MNCQNFESVVNELARQQMMAANLRQEALAHTSECGACALRLADERALTQQLRALTAEMNELAAPARIEGELLTAFGNYKATGQFTSQATRQQRSAIQDWRYWATAAAAAVLLLFIGIVATSLRSRPATPAPLATQNPTVPPAQTTVANPNDGGESPDAVAEPKPAALPPPGTAMAIGNPTRKSNSLAARSNAAARRSERDALAARRETVVAANYSGNEIATEFLPLGYASPMNLQDGGQVMRVELPRSALARFGLPVNLERVNERVKADVLVGSDGQARAIRFVQ